MRGQLVTFLCYRMGCFCMVRVGIVVVRVGQRCGPRIRPIETLFSDQKSYGFHLHLSHLSDPTRLSRLLIAACLAYLPYVCQYMPLTHSIFGAIVLACPPATSHPLQVVVRVFLLGSLPASCTAKDASSNLPRVNVC